jgi:site-specific DNA recombinase
MGTVAEMELEAISERNKSAAQHSIKQGRYRGSVPRRDTDLTNRRANGG